MVEGGLESPVAVIPDSALLRVIEAVHLGRRQRAPAILVRIVGADLPVEYVDAPMLRQYDRTMDVRKAGHGNISTDVGDHQVTYIKQVIAEQVKKTQKPEM